MTVKLDNSEYPEKLSTYGFKLLIEKLLRNELKVYGEKGSKTERGIIRLRTDETPIPHEPINGKKTFSVTYGGYEEEGIATATLSFPEGEFSFRRRITIDFVIGEGFTEEDLNEEEKEFLKKKKAFPYEDSEEN